MDLEGDLNTKDLFRRLGMTIVGYGVNCSMRLTKDFFSS